MRRVPAIRSQWYQIAIAGKSNDAHAINDSPKTLSSAARRESLSGVSLASCSTPLEIYARSMALKFSVANALGFEIPITVGIGNRYRSAFISVSLRFCCNCRGARLSSTGPSDSAKDAIAT
jgi:hypothetical protein